LQGKNIDCIVWAVIAQKCGRQPRISELINQVRRCEGRVRVRL